MSDAEDRSRRRRLVTGHLVREGGDRDAFDIEFWRSVPPEKRVEAIWDLVLELQAIQGDDGAEPRLDRAVEHIQRP